MPRPCRPRSLARALAHVAHDPSLSEVILSGGDPLTLGDEKLAEFVRALKDLRHIKRLRLHTRVPVVVPSRVTAELLALLRSSPVPVAMVLARKPRPGDR